MLKSLKKLGPGFLFAGAAVGVSHLVQSTRAGANYGLELLWVIPVCMFFKYPFLEFGNRYAIVARKSLIKGFYEDNRTLFWIIFIQTFLSMAIIMGAVSFVAGALLENLLGDAGNAKNYTYGILFICFVVLSIGKYSFLDQLMKVLIIMLSISTLLTVLFVIPSLEVSSLFSGRFDFGNTSNVAFLIAFMGWMPTPVDTALWQSEWTLAKIKDDHKFTYSESVFDFKVGYLGTMILAVLFVVLGSSVAGVGGTELGGTAVEFSKDLVSLYTNVVGDWAWPFFAVAAFATMFSTVITCFDAFGRVGERFITVTSNVRIGRKAFLFSIMVGTIFLLSIFLTSLRALVDFATVLGFLTAPLVAYMNYRLATSESFPEDYRFNSKMKVWAFSGLLFLSFFSLWYLFSFL